jgi:ectoine hydroxylase-related dioxygenase (phytanoyl-CoA dioxygenase family)
MENKEWTAMEVLERELASTNLSRAQVSAFDERGYHIHGKLFSDNEIEALRHACERVCQGEYETGSAPDGVGWKPSDDPLKVRKIDNCWKANRTIAAAVLSERIGHIAAQLINAPSIRMFHDQFLHKPAFGGKVVTFHQDWAYWQMIGECQTVTCWIALDNVRPDAGPMVFLEGSHKLGLFPLPKGISGDDTQEPILPEGFACKRVPVIIPAGHVSFHHGLTLHGSDRNTSPITRRAMVSHVMSGECTYRPGQRHLNEDWMKKQPGCPQPGEKLSGPQFPLLWPKS